MNRKQYFAYRHFDGRCGVQEEFYDEQGRRCTRFPCDCNMTTVVDSDAAFNDAKKIAEALAKLDSCEFKVVDNQLEDKSKYTHY